MDQDLYLFNQKKFIIIDIQYVIKVNNEIYRTNDKMFISDKI